jgi:hypothetical protein
VEYASKILEEIDQKNDAPGEANAITHYNQAVQEDDNCNLCKAYLMYQNVLNSFKKVQEKYNAQMEEHCRRSVGHFVQQIDNAKN